MNINILQKNKHGDNTNNIEDSFKNNIQLKNQIIWKARAEGLITGVIISVIANFIYDLIK